MPYLPRLLAKHLIGLRQSSDVFIVEGPRAVGKSTMLKTELQGQGDYSYVELSDGAVRELAESDTEKWLHQLKSPAIIDEAQLLPGLPVALKKVVDEPSQKSHFVLSGSAAIGRTGLGGANPLTRRSQRFLMHPLTQWEMSYRTGSLVDFLFDNELVIGAHSAVSDETILERMRQGGFPGYVFPNQILTRSDLSRKVSSDIVHSLSDPIDPELDMNATRARVVFDAFLRTPGGIFNALNLAKQTGYDRRTIERYLDIFTSRLFLLHSLENAASPPRKQSYARNKIHPFDTSFSVEALERAGVDLLQRREWFGQLLESHVVNQLVASIQWANRDYRASYWRQASSTSPEVDLVILDDRNRAVAIEVKASTRLGHSDTKGIRAYAAELGESFHKGFVFYQGAEVVALDSKIWAVPIAALGDSFVFEEGQVEKNAEVSLVDLVVPQSAAAIDADAKVFVSYVRADDEAENGRIVQFVKDVANSYALLYGHELELFIDREDIRWGQSWQQQISSAIDTTTFLMSVQTPRYLRSEACRKEVLDFSASVRSSAEPRLLLPLIWIDTKGADVVADDDPVLQRLTESQYVDVSEIRMLDRQSTDYRRGVEAVAKRLRETIVARTQVGRNESGPAELVSDDSGIIELMNDVVEKQRNFESILPLFKSSFDAIGDAFAVEPIPQGVDTYAAAAVVGRLANRLEEPIKELEQSTQAIGLAWSQIDKLIGRILLKASVLPAATRQQMRESLVGLVQTLDIPGIDQMEQVSASVGAISQKLQPASRALVASVRLIKGIQDSARAWERSFRS